MIERILISSLSGIQTGCLYPAHGDAPSMREGAGERCASVLPTSPAGVASAAPPTAACTEPRSAQYSGHRPARHAIRLRSGVRAWPAHHVDQGRVRHSRVALHRRVLIETEAALSQRSLLCLRGASNASILPGLWPTVLRYGCHLLNEAEFGSSEKRSL